MIRLRPREVTGHPQSHTAGKQSDQQIKQINTTFKMRLPLKGDWRVAGRHTRSKFLSKCDSDTLEPIWALTGGESVLCRAWGARSGSRKFPAHLLKGTQESPFFEENSLKVTGCVCPNRRVKEDRCGVKSVLLILCPLPLHTHRSTLHLLCSARYPGSDPCRHITSSLPSHFWLHSASGQPWQQLGGRVD